MTHQHDAICAYWNTRSEGYSCKHQDELMGESAREWTERFKQHLPIRPGLRVLDIGCGPGLFSILLAKLGCTVTALDASPGMLEQARANAAAQGVDVNFVEGDAMTLADVTGPFDAIVSRYLVWNLPDPTAAYGVWLNALVPGGTLLAWDGNHYLYQTDPRYAIQHDDARGGAGHAERYLRGVDVSPMERIAATLPLSRIERPLWDIDTFTQLGARVETPEIVTANVTDPKTGETYELTTEFLVKAQRV